MSVDQITLTQKININTKTTKDSLGERVSNKIRFTTSRRSTGSSFYSISKNKAFLSIIFGSLDIRHKKFNKNILHFINFYYNRPFPCNWCSCSDTSSLTKCSLHYQQNRHTSIECKQNKKKENFSYQNFLTELAAHFFS